MTFKVSRRVLVILTVISVTLLLVLLAVMPQPVPADFATAVRGNLIVTIDDEGETRMKDVYVVSAPVAGRLLRIDIEAGDTVLAGETMLAQFQPSDPVILDVRTRSEAEAAVKGAEATVGLTEAERDRAAAQLDFANAELRRGIPLAKEGTISQSTLERRELYVKTALAVFAEADAAVRKSRADLETARAALITSSTSENGASAQEFMPVRAPINGRVLRLLQESESVLSAGAPLLEVGDPTKLEIVADLLSADAVKIRVGDAVIIDQWGGDTSLQGRVRLIEPFGFTKISALGIEEQRVNVIIDFTSTREEWLSLGHGYRVETRVVIHDRRNVLKVPISALFRTKDSWSVFVQDDGKARLRIVELGQRNNLEAEIIAGLEEGEQVILHPSDRIISGVSLTDRNDM